jgi:hypothetical protein
MEFIGELVWGSPAEVNWLRMQRNAYELAGVKFSKFKGHFYTDPLSTDQVISLTDHPWVKLVALGEGEGDLEIIPIENGVVGETEIIEEKRKPGRPRKS